LIWTSANQRKGEREGEKERGRTMLEETDDGIIARKEEMESGKKKKGHMKSF